MDAIGGYFPLSLMPSKHVPAWYDGAIAYNSARTALVAHLLAVKSKLVYVPSYTCGSVRQALTQFKINYVDYTVTADALVPSDLTLKKNQHVIVNNYFGLFDRQTQQSIKRLGPEHVIVDAAQALYFTPAIPCTTIYSPRKFFGAYSAHEKPPFRYMRSQRGLAERAC